MSWLQHSWYEKSHPGPMFISAPMVWTSLLCLCIASLQMRNGLEGLESWCKINKTVRCFWFNFHTINGLILFIMQFSSVIIRNVILIFVVIISFTIPSSIIFRVMGPTNLSLWGWPWFIFLWLGGCWLEWHLDVKLDSVNVISIKEWRRMQ